MESPLAVGGATLCLLIKWMRAFDARMLMMMLLTDDGGEMS
jgi:hypothetical protein